MSETPQPPAAEPAAPAPGAPVPPPAPAPAKPAGKALPIAAAVLAGIAFLTSVIPGPSGSTWAFAIAAIVCAIIALVRKAPMRGLSIAAVIVAPVAWLIAIIVTVAGVFVVGANLPSTSGDTDTDTGTSQESVDPEPDEPASTISGGDHIVGTDFAAGQYRAEVDEGIIALCTVSQAEGDNILDARNATEGSVIFTVQDIAGSVVSFSGCSDIALAADVVRATPSSITNGDWLVGTELPAGQYKGTVDTKALIALGTISQSDGKNVLGIQIGDEGDVIFTVKDVPNSVVSFSGLTGIQKVG
ncbi:MAG TPA: hypothetical protein VNR36_00720 [Pseudolysinimonas sp.]|nr:hypothetical protein [Pseudolysinimonas sp.]